MKASEFRQLIREEIRRVLKEADREPTALQFNVNVAGRTSDGKNFNGPYKLIPSFKVKLSISTKGDGDPQPSSTGNVRYLSIFRNQLVGKDMGRISITFTIPWGSVDEMGNTLIALIAKTYSQDTVKTDRGTLADAKDLKKLLDRVVDEKWSSLTDDAINNPKALQMMYGMGAAIERVAAVQ